MQKLETASLTIRRVVDKLIADRQAGATQALFGHDLLDLLLAARDADTGERMNETLLRDELVTFLLAGEGTSHL